LLENFFLYLNVWQFWFFHWGMNVCMHKMLEKSWLLSLCMLIYKTLSCKIVWCMRFYFFDYLEMLIWMHKIYWFCFYFECVRILIILKDKFWIIFFFIDFSKPNVSMQSLNLLGMNFDFSSFCKRYSQILMPDTKIVNVINSNILMHTC